MRENKIIVVNEFSSPSKTEREDPSQIGSAEKKSPEKKEFLRRNVTKYDPRRSIEIEKSKERLYFLSISLLLS